MESRIRRPLLNFEKKEIKKIVKEFGLKWSEVSTNSD